MMIRLIVLNILLHFFFVAAQGQFCIPSVTVASAEVIPSCPGKNSGQIKATVGSGTQPFKVYVNNETNPRITNAGYSITLSNLAAGTYQFRIVDARGCSLTIPSVTVPTATVASIKINSPEIVCAGNTFEVSALLGGTTTPPYTYAWNTGKTGDRFTTAITTATSYSVTATDGNGCQIISPTTRVQTSATPVVNMPASIESCSGETVTLSPVVSGGTPSYVYLWSTGSKSPYIKASPTSNTYYYLTVSDSKGCQASGSTLVSPTKTLSVSLPTALETCENTSTTLTPSIGQNAGSLTYLWSTGAKSSTLIVPGETTKTYAVTVADAAGCAGMASTTVTVNVPPTINFKDQYAVCRGSTVTINPNLTTAQGPYIYRWSTGATTATLTLTPTAAQTVTLTIIDAKKCSRQKSTEILLNTVPDVSLPASVTACSNVSTVITPSIKSGTSPYLYKWSTGETDAVLKHTFAKDELLSLEVKDQNGCGGIASTSVKVYYPPGISLSPTTESCPGQAVTLEPEVGGNGPFTYAWSTGSTAASIQVSPKSATSYSITVTDKLGCSSRSESLVSASKTLSVVLPSAQSVCERTSITLTPQVNGASGSLKYAWSTGASGATLTATVLQNTTYGLTVYDGVGCSGNGSSSISVLVPPTINLPDIQNGCPGASIILNPALDPTYGPFSYLWSNGEKTATLNLQPAQNTQVGLTITDKNKCTREKSVSIQLLPAPDVSLPTTLAACSNQEKTIPATVSGGTPDYSFVWSTGATGPVLKKTFGKNESVQVVVLDAKGCKDSALVEVQVFSPPAVVFSTGTETCPGQSIILSPAVSGGTAGYSFFWSTGSKETSIQVAPTTTTSYSVTVTDSKTCNGVGQATVSPTAKLTVELPTSLSACEQGTITVTPVVRGATGTLSYNWSTGTSGATLNTIVTTNASALAVTVTDGVGCKGVGNTAVTVYPTPVINLPSDISSCPGGTVTLNPRLNPSYAPYTYGWSTGAVSSTLTLQPTADVSVGITVTDSHQCTQSKQVAIHIAAAPEIDLPVSLSVCANAAASVRATLLGGFPESYQVTWSTGELGITLYRVFEKDELVWARVSDAGGCVDSDTVRILVHPPPVVQLPDTLISCPGEMVLITPVVTGGTGTYSYVWDSGSTNATLSVAPLVPGRYQLRVHDALGCVGQDSTWVSASKTLSVALPAEWSGCAETALTLSPVVSGNSGGLSYSWSTGATTPTLSMQAVSNTILTVQVADVQGCTGTANTRLTVYPLPQITLPDAVSVCLGGTLELNPGLSATAYAYSWSTGASTPTLWVQPSMHTGIGLTVTDTHGCVRSKTVALSIGPGPQIELPDTLHACQGAEVALRPLVSGGQPMYSYLWSDGSTATSLNKVVLAETTIGLRIRDAVGCLDSASIRIIADTPPAFDLSDRAEVCKGNAIRLALENIRAKLPLTVSWSNGATIPEIIWQGERDTSLRVTVRDGLGCETRDSIQLTVLRIEGVYLVNDSAVCEGASVRLQLQGADQLAVEWNTGEQTAAIEARPERTQLYQVSFQDKRGCRDSLSTTVTVFNLPNISLPAQLAVCQGDSLRLEPAVASGNALPLRFQWDDGSVEAPRLVAPPYQSRYELRVQDARGCTRLLPVAIQSRPLPTVGLPDTLRVCTGASFVLEPMFQNQSAIASIGWSEGEESSVYVGKAVEPLTIYCTVRDTQGCTGIDSTYLALSPTPAIVLPEKVHACTGDKVRFIPLSTGGDSYVQWSNGTIAPFLEVLAQEDADYQAVISTAAGCTDTAVVALDVHDLPDVRIDGVSGICAGQTDTLQALVEGGSLPLIYAWSTGSTDSYSEISPANGSASVVLRVQDVFGCVGLDTLEVQVLDAPVIELDDIPAVCKGSTGFLAPLVIGGSRPYKYKWSTGESSSTLSVSSGTYTLEVADAAGCRDSMQVEVPQQEGPEVTVLALNHPACNKYDGMVELSVRTQRPPALVQWSDGTIGTRIERVFSGTYQVAVSDKSPCVEELEFQLSCACLARAGTMDPVPLTLCKYEEKAPAYAVQTEVIPAGYQRWFVLHNGPGNALGNTVLSVDTSRVLRYVAGALAGKTYYFSAVIAPVLAGGGPDLGDICIAVSPGTPVVFRPTPEKPALLEVADTTVCPGSSILISTNRQESGFMYVWETPSGTFTTGTPVFTVADFHKADEGSYRVSVVSEGCHSPWLGPLNLGISKDIDEIFTEADKVVCGVDSTRLQANAPAGALGKWLTSSPARIAAPEKENSPVYDLVPGTNLFLWTVITHNCIIQDSLEVYYTPRPELQDDTVALDDEKNATLFNMLQNDSLNDIPLAFLKINLLSQPAVGGIKLDSSGSITYIRDNSIAEDQVLTFVYQVCNTDPTGNCPNSCDEAEVILNIAYSPRTLAFPALGLRPGSANPVWQFEAARPMFSANLAILDRWGQVVFREKYDAIQKGELVKAWNGLRGNAPVPPGAYYYTLEGTIENNEKIVQNGILYLLD